MNGRLLEHVHRHRVQLYARPQLQRLLLSTPFDGPEPLEDATERPHDDGRDEERRTDDLHRQLPGRRQAHRREAEDGDEDAEDEEADGEDEHAAAESLERRPATARPAAVMTVDAVSAVAAAATATVTADVQQFGAFEARQRRARGATR